MKSFVAGHHALSTFFNSRVDKALEGRSGKGSKILQASLQCEQKKKVLFVDSSGLDHLAVTVRVKRSS